MTSRIGLALLVGLACAASTRAQPVDGDVTAIGFRTTMTNGSGLVIRQGQWVPIQVQLRVQGSEHFQGQLRVEAPDLDGDLVSYVESPVTVTAGAGFKQVWCYAVWLWNRDQGGIGVQPSVDLLSRDGVLIRHLKMPDCDLISNDTMLILDISTKPLTRLRSLETSGWSGLERGYGSRPYYRNILVAAMPAAELPDRWIGLEAVDAVVWDEPDPTAVSIAQLHALREWVANGGQLVLGLGRSWLAVQKSELADLAPVQSIAASPNRGGAEPPAMLEVAQLEEFFKRFVDSSYQHDQSGPRTFPAPISIANADAKPGALRAVRTLVPGGGALDLLTARWIGSGRVVASAAGLRDLMQVPVNQAFYEQLFDLNPTTQKFLESETGSLQFTLAIDLRRLYRDVVEPIGFKGWSSLLVLAAFAFVVAYIGLATLGSWAWLKRHRLAVLSWTVFAVFAIVASTVSLATVGVLHGLSRGVHEYSLVDAEAGARAATVKCYFGYSSPSRTPLNLSLPGDGAFLRPLARGPEGSGTYATPRRYSVPVGKALLEEAPRRATLKQYEGFSHGDLTGTIRADLTASRETGEITPGSWIQNDLDWDVLGGYLLYVDPRFQDDDYPTRPAGKTTNYWKRTDVPPALNVLALWCPSVRAGQKVGDLGQEEYQRIVRAREAWSQRPKAKPEDMPDLFTLWDEQQEWAGLSERSSLRTADHRPRYLLNETARASLLASTRVLYLHCDETFTKATKIPISTDGLMNCDISHWLMQGRVKAAPGQTDDPLVGQGVLLLMVADSGLARLQGDGKPLGPVSGTSLYRVRVPISFTGSPPRELPGGAQP